MNTKQIMNLARKAIRERWTGTYARTLARSWIYTLKMHLDHSARMPKEYDQRNWPLNPKPVVAKEPEQEELARLDREAAYWTEQALLAEQHSPFQPSDPRTPPPYTPGH